MWLRRWVPPLPSVPALCLCLLVTSGSTGGVPTYQAVPAFDTAQKEDRVLYADKRLTVFFGKRVGSRLPTFNVLYLTLDKGRTTVKLSSWLKPQTRIFESVAATKDGRLIYVSANSNSSPSEGQGEHISNTSIYRFDLIRHTVTEVVRDRDLRVEGRRIHGATQLTLSPDERFLEFFSAHEDEQNLGVAVTIPVVPSSVDRAATARAARLIVFPLRF